MKQSSRKCPVKVREEKHFVWEVGLFRPISGPSPNNDAIFNNEAVGGGVTRPRGGHHQMSQPLPLLAAAQRKLPLSCKLHPPHIHIN